MKAYPSYYIIFFFLCTVSLYANNPMRTLPGRQHRSPGSTAPTIFKYTRKATVTKPIFTLTRTLKNYVDALASPDNEILVQEFFWALLENAMSHIPTFFKDTCIDFVAYRLALGLFYLLHRNIKKDHTGQNFQML